MVYLASGGFWLVAGQVGAATTAFAFSLAVAHYLPQYIYGSYRYIFSLVAIIGAFSLTGLGTTVVRSVALGFDSSLRHGYYRNLAWSLPLLVGFAVTSGYYAFSHAYEIATAIAVAGAATAVINAASLHNAYWSGKKDFYRGTLYWTIANTTATGATILAMILTDQLLALIGAYFITAALVNTLLYYSIARHVPVTPKSIEEARMEQDSVHLSLLNFLNTVAGQIDKIIVFQMLGPTQLAIYSFALALPEQLRGVLKSGARLALPRFAERDFAQIQGSLGARLLRFSLLILILATAYVFAAPLIFTLLFPTYRESVQYSQLFALTLFTTLGTIPLAALQAHAKLRALYTHSIIANVVQLSSSISLIYFFGLWGAAVAVVLNRAVNLLVPLYLFKKT